MAAGRRTIRNRRGFERREPRRLGMRPIVERSFVGQRAIRNLRHHLAVILHPQDAVAVTLPHRHRVQSPLVEDGEHFGFAAFVGHQQHALLRFRQHDLVRRHAGFALRHVLQIDFDARARAAAHLAGGAREPGGAHVLNADDGAGLHRFQTGFEQKLFEKRIAHLHVRTLLLGLLGELGRRHRRAVNAVAAGLRADVNHRVADAGGLAVEDFVLAEHAQRERVHQRIAVVAIFENALAADGGDTEAVPVMRDARNNAFENAAIAREYRADRSESHPSPRWAARPW